MQENFIFFIFLSAPFHTRVLRHDTHTPHTHTLVDYAAWIGSSECSVVSSSTVLVHDTSGLR